MQSVKLNQIVLGSAWDSTKEEKPHLIIVSRATYKPYDVVCKSYDCIHVRYLMSLPDMEINYLNAIDRICPECKHYNLQDAIFCINCGSKIRKVD